MDAVPQFGPGDGFARADHLVEALVLGNLPTHRYRRHRHTAMFLQRPGRKAGPDDEAVRTRITRGDSQRERVTDEFRSSTGAAVRVTPREEDAQIGRAQSRERVGRK